MKSVPLIFFTALQMSLTKICDGTVINTGHKGGVIRLYEEYLQHALQRLTCLLHFSELPLRALFTKIDGHHRTLCILWSDRLNNQNLTEFTVIEVPLHSMYPT